MQDLPLKRRNALSGTADNIVMILHGLGANGDDVIQLADHFAENMPNTLFLAPDAPHKASMAPDGRQWFSMPELDGTSHIELGVTMQESILRVMETLNNEAEVASVPAGRQILIGFSQGGMLALQIAPRLDHALCCVVSIAGMLLDAESLAYEARSFPPVLLCHDRMDDVVPFDRMAAARDALIKHPFRVHTHATKDAGHSIHPATIGCIVHFMQRELMAGDGPAGTDPSSEVRE